MTNLNRLFAKYFIITITIVLVIITVISNIGGALFFKNFITKRNDEQNKKIVSAVNEMVNTSSLSVNKYPFLLSLISRQEQANLILYRDDLIIAYSVSGAYASTLESTEMNAEEALNEQIQVIKNLIGNDDIRYIDYDLGFYKLSIGRAVDPLFDIANANFVKTLNVFYIVAFGIAMFIAFFAALILARRFNRPIMQLRDNVNHISMNRYEKIGHCDTKAAELKELSDDINELSVKIKNEEELRKRLSDDIVHELKTPIAVLATNIEAILDGIYKADAERMSVLLSQTNRLTRLVNNLSELTMLETENAGTSMEPVNLSGVLDSIYTVYLPAATDKEIELIKDFEDDLFINGNEDRMLQVFVNIVSNSLKYTDAGGKIFLRLYSANSKVVCEIEDTGIGIKERDLPFIFNRFYRGDESRSRETGGSGIGLAIVKAVVSAHEGEIKIESKEGKGTKISVVFKKLK